MKIIFYRILGNDIPVRHRPDQTLTNLSYILKHEPALPGCEKSFLLNRIVHPATKERLISIIEEAGFRWHNIPFNPDDFRRLETDKEKALYLTNQNAARNRCIDLGLSEGDVVLPFDGQMFFNAEGWSGMIGGLKADLSAKYVTVPMFRLRSNQHALGPWHRPGSEDEDHLSAEPQIVVRDGHDIRFDERLSYGKANKVELLMRLGVKGPWDEWSDAGFMRIRAELPVTRSQSFGQVRDAGFVFRLESGNWKAERSASIRSSARGLGLGEFISRIDQEFRK